jgi:uncharacterized damage-inducible protein DinB
MGKPSVRASQSGQPAPGARPCYIARASDRNVGANDMTGLALMNELLSYGHTANLELLQAAAPLTDAQLDRVFPMGRGTLRLTLMHIVVAEEVWLARWQGNVEQPWGNEKEVLPNAAMRERAQAVHEARLAFVRRLADGDLDRAQRYRDSKGRLFDTRLGQMLLQGLLHSVHHRAQAANMLRQLGSECPDMDYMMHVRQPA